MTNKNFEEEINVLEYAENYLAFGLSVIPLVFREKNPKLKEWKEFQTRLPTKEEIQEWFKNNDLNIAIVCGRVSGNLVVLDFDDYEIYLKWLKKLSQDIKDILAQTWIVRTKRGVHIYFRLDCDEKTFEEKGKTKKNLQGIKGLELRGEGTYVVAPPSIHPDGIRYEFIRGYSYPPLKIDLETFNKILNTLKEREETIETKKIELPKEFSDIFIDFDKPLSPQQRTFLINVFRCFWIPGYRHKLTFALVGWLIKNRIKYEHAYNIISQIGLAENDEELFKDRLKNVGEQYFKRINVVDIEKMIGIGGLLENIKQIIENNYDELIQKLQSFYNELNEKYKGRKKGIVALVERTIEIIKGIKSGTHLFDDLERLLRKSFRQLGLETTYKPTIEIHTATELHELNFQPTYVIDKVIPEHSLVLLAGKPSSGKSWLALYFGLCVANGEKVFGKFDVKQTKVFYLDLETSYELFSLRIKALGMKSDNFFYVQVKDYENLKNEIRKIIEKVPNSLIIIDSLSQLLRGDENKAQTITKFFQEFLAPLKEKATFIIIHHTRKPQPNVKDKDPIFEIRGSSQIAGMVDLIYLLRELEGTLQGQIEGGGFRRNIRLFNRKHRYLPELSPIDFSIISDGQKTRIEFLGETYVIRTEDLIREEIAKYLKEHPGSKKKEIIDAVNKSLTDRGLEIHKQQIEHVFKELEELGWIERFGKKYYWKSIRKLSEYYKKEKSQQSQEQENNQGGTLQKIPEKREFEVLNEPIFGPCAYCGSQKPLFHKDENGNYVCEDCVKNGG